MHTRYVNAGSGHVAYRVLGDGPVDFLIFLGEYLPVDAPDEEPRYARCLRRLGAMGRVILFNPRGVGLSDPPEGPSTLEQHAADALAVIDAVGCKQVAVCGWNVAGPTAIHFVGAHPDRVSALVLVNTFARLLAARGYAGLAEDAVATTAAQTTDTDADLADDPFDFLRAFAPSVAHDSRFRAWWEQAGHRGAGPARSRELWRMMMLADERDTLAAIRAPTVVIHRAELAALPRELGRFIADGITAARYVELPGRDLMWWVGDSDSVLDEIETFMGSLGGGVRPRRRLASVLFVDVVGSTERAVALGDRRWRDLLDTYRELSARELGRFGGEDVGTAGDGMVATFDMPADAINCARELAAQVHALGIEIRAGVHTGEIEVLGDDIAGIGVHTAARVMDHARSGEVLVSRTVADLVAGSDIAFEDRGEHALKGVPGTWRLFAVVAPRT